MIVGYVGPPGSGKTTLLKLVATLLRPSGGDAHVLGHSLRHEPDEIRKRTGLLTVRGFLYDDLSAAENLHFTMRMAGLKPRREVIARVLERIGLAEVADNRMRTFSTGMRKRLALGQLKRVLDAYAAHDVARAMEVWGSDEEIDELRKKEVI